MSVHTTPDSYTKLLIHSNGPDNGQSFVDSSGNHTVSAEGDVKHENTQTFARFMRKKGIIFAILLRIQDLNFTQLQELFFNC